MSNRIDLLVPGLFGPVPIPPEDLPPLPALERLLARADRIDAPAGDPLAALFSRFGIRPEPGQDLPSAPYCRLADDPAADPSGYWMHADPAHLRPDRDQLLLFDARHLDLGQEEADALTAELNAHFEADGLHFEVPVPNRWYLRLGSAPRVRTNPLHTAAGRGIGPLLPEGEDRSSWARLLNEAQMLLHHSQVNRARETTGRLTVSGVWLWGGGRLPQEPPATDYEIVYAEHPLALGLAKAAGLRVRALPDDVGARIPDDSEGARLVFWDALWPAVQDADAETWVRGLTRLERLASGLLGLVRTGRIGRLDVDCCAGRLFRVTRSGLRRFWRRAPAFGERLSPSSARARADAPRST